MTRRKAKARRCLAEPSLPNDDGMHPGISSYAIPTKDERIRTLPLDVIRRHVRTFLDFARSRPDVGFQITPIDCGLTGYRPEQNEF
jgi:hypothetical protein